MKESLERNIQRLILAIAIVADVVLFVLSTRNVERSHTMTNMVHGGAVALGVLLIAFKGKFPSNWQTVVEWTAIVAPASVLLAEMFK